MSAGKITLDELAARFGGEIPASVAALLWSCPPEWTVEKVREGDFS